ncbi:MAG: TIGR00730 family Rossman fold protein [Gammaproteobacteria bacterium]|nr:TIGR00730 family Rossman fold protein [Gammaproteobacteria bacterium]
MKRICVFAGSRRGAMPEYSAAAKALGRELVSRGLGLVYGGGKLGLMGVIADQVLELGGHVTGIIPDSLIIKEQAHQGVSEMHVVTTMHQRKAMMVDLSTGFIALPGGLGTLDETFEILTYNQLGIHDHPCGLLNVEGYYDSLLHFLNHSIDQEFVREAHKSLIIVDADVSQLVDRIASNNS